jgi:Cof subfamily protein (haloacid dehalogenase superfamily)
MIRTELFQKLKLAALDLDGTLLGERAEVSSENAAAVRRMQAAGVHVVLASGRHHTNMRNYAEALGGVEWIVACQGGEAADVRRGRVLRREFLPTAKAQLGFDLGKDLGFTSLAYGVENICTDSTWNPDIQFYADLAGRAPAHAPREKCLEFPVFKVIWLGDPEKINGAVNAAASIQGVQMVRTHAKIIEMMPLGVSKASGLKAVAESLGIQPGEAAVFGDGDNDVPMFEWAGVSVAMAHGWPSALKAATYVTAEGCPNSALARGIDLLFAKGLFGGNHHAQASTQASLPTVAPVMP